MAEKKIIVEYSQHILEHFLGAKERFASKYSKLSIKNTEEDDKGPWTETRSYALARKDRIQRVSYIDLIH